MPESLTCELAEPPIVDVLYIVDVPTKGCNRLYESGILAFKATTPLT